MSEAKLHRRVAVECACGWDGCDGYFVVDESEVPIGRRVIGLWREWRDSDADDGANPSKRPR